MKLARCGTAPIALFVGLVVAAASAAPPAGKTPASSGAKVSGGTSKAQSARKPTSPQAGSGRLGQAANPQAAAGKGGRDFFKTPNGWARRDQRHAIRNERLAGKPDKNKPNKYKPSKDTLTDNGLENENDAADADDAKGDKDKQTIGPRRRLDTPSNRAEAHARALQHRLAAIERMRDRAIESGDEDLLKQADSLEKKARDWHARQSGIPTPVIEPGTATPAPTEASGPILLPTTETP